MAGPTLNTSGVGINPQTQTTYVLGPANTLTPSSAGSISTSGVGFDQVNQVFWIIGPANSLTEVAEEEPA